jgi:hypothetical protein
MNTEAPTTASRIEESAESKQILGSSQITVLHCDVRSRRLRHLRPLNRS